jgi:RNA polymerase sigma factor (sigma-70 family)
MGEHDGILLERWETSGDQQAFMELVTRYQGMVFGVCVRIVKDHARAEDLVQECFLKLTNTRPRNIHLLGPWLHRVATNTSINQLGSDQRRQAREKKYMADAQSAHETNWDDLSDILDEEINTLSIDSREVIVAHFLEGHTQVEIAERLGITRQAVHKRIARGLDSLHQKLKSRGVVVPAAALAAMMASEITVAASASLAATMGKAVLSGVFAPAKTAAVGLPKILFALAASVVLILGGVVALNAFRDTDQTAPGVSVTENIPAPETPILASTESVDTAPSLDEGPARGGTRIKCVDQDGNPVAGALVYVFQRGRNPISSTWAWDKRNVPYQADGPIVSNDDGYFEYDLFESEAGYVYTYAVIPGEQVGAWSGKVSSDSSMPKPIKQLIMVPSMRVPGKVTIPPEFNMSTVKIDLLSASFPFKSLRMGNTYDNPGAFHDGVWAGLFDIFIDAQGNFEIPNVPVDGDFWLRGYGPGLGDARGKISGESTNRFVDMHIGEEGVIEGTVRYADTGAAVAGRKVFCRNKTVNSGFYHAATTDAFGNYRIVELGPGMYDVMAGIEREPRVDISRPKSRVEVESGVETGQVDLLIENGTMITGTFTVKETGEPVEHAGISAITPGVKGAPINYASSDASGRFEMRLPLGENILVITSIPNGVSRIEGKDELSISLSSDDIQPRSFDFQFTEGTDPMGNYFREMLTEEITDPATTISGRVFDTNRNVIDGVQVVLMKRVPMAGGMSTHRKTIEKTDPEGRFSMAMIPGKKYSMIVGGNGWSAWKGKEFTAKEDTARTIDDVFLEKFTAELSFEIVNEEGRPIAHTQYGVSNKNYHREGQFQTSNANGFFHIDQLPGDHVQISFYREGYDRYKWEGEPGQHVKVVMKRKKDESIK